MYSAPPLPVTMFEVKEQPVITIANRSSGAFVVACSSLNLCSKCSSITISRTSRKSNLAQIAAPFAAVISSKILEYKLAYENLSI